MSALTKEQCDQLPASMFADDRERLMPVLDLHDLRVAVKRCPFSKDPARVRRRIVQMALQRGWASALPKAWERDISEAQEAVRQEIHEQADRFCAAMNRR
jgi:hypothetical protein